MTLFSKKTSPYLAITVVLILFRAFLNYAVPLMDKTEARYAEIARIMAETNNWTTLQIDYGIPFWAKPPLSTWLSAMSFQLFGVNEFAARFPYLLLSIIVVSCRKFYFPFFLSISSFKIPDQHRFVDKLIKPLWCVG